jgi:FG-GAP-like repeat
MSAISKERMKVMNRRMTMSVMMLGLLLGLAPVSQGQPQGGCTSGSFSQAADSPFGVGAEPQSVAVGDFNLDGKPDLATANSGTLFIGSNNVTILVGNGMGGFTPAGPFEVGTAPQSVAVGDFNLDGKPDLVTANFRSNNVAILLNTCLSTPLTDPPPMPATPVVVDIKPGKPRNRINLFRPNSWRAIPVAIITTETFDATTVNPRSVRFGPRGARDTDGRGRLVDVNGDGKLDLVLRFKTRRTGIGCGETSASLTGKTFSGQAVQGSDAIRTVGCNDDEEEDEDEDE